MQSRVTSQFNPFGNLQHRLYAGCVEIYIQNKRHNLQSKTNRTTCPFPLLRKTKSFPTYYDFNRHLQVMQRDKQWHVRH